MTKTRIKKAQQNLPAASPAAVKAFVETMFGRSAPEDLDLAQPDIVAQAAQRHWQMAAKRKPGETKIAIQLLPLEKDEWSAGRTVIDIVVDDMAFLVDSVVALLTTHYRPIHVIIHPILHARRGKTGALEDIGAAQGDGTHAESHMHIQLQGAIAADSVAQLEKDLRGVLDDVRIVNDDWQKMRERLRECQRDLTSAPASFDRQEIADDLNFLDYIYQDNFTLLGYREYRFTKQGGRIKSETVKKAGLGLLRPDSAPVYASDGGFLPDNLQKLRLSLPPLTIAKVNRPSPVHRPVPMDAVAIKIYDRAGNVTGEHLFLGLFTSVTYSRSIQDVPLLRQKTESIMTRSGFRIGSHNYKALRHILEKYPRDELFQMGLDELFETTQKILRLQKRQNIALFARKDIFGRYVSCLVYVPREKYDARLRGLFQSLLEQGLHGTCSDFYATLDDSPLARLMFTIETDQRNPPSFDAAALEKQLQDAGQDWSAKLAAALLTEYSDEKQITALTHKYSAAFPAAYRDHYLPRQAVWDIRRIEETSGSGRIALDLYRSKGCGPRELRLKIFNAGAPLVLSDILPVLENMGMNIVSELPFQITPRFAQDVWVQDFMLVAAADMADADIAAVKSRFEDLVSRTWYGETEDDDLNALVLGARMDWREIMILRAYVRYMRQMRYPLGTAYVEKALTGNAAISRLLTDLFMAMHDPAHQKTSKRDADAARTAIAAALQKVASLDEDRVIRTVMNLIENTLRTNFFQTGADGQPKTYLSFKFDSAKIAGLPDPRPYREIYVYSRRAEGIHLRGDVIARGGIRWSDRHEDFRTEVLGLMKAQQVKNAIIVPMGAKGGFIVKNPPAQGGREAQQKEGIECYKILVRGLLDITDNRQGKKVVPPKNVVRHDGDDPYLVVAADKGTATFSDIANALSLEYGHWLGDAFASGGSAGYDHKKMGITAKGAWESIKRHFRELGHDIQKKPFDVIGVGDMGGDVFGNGMLLSPHIRLVGAFNHVHIFCDPDPDTASSFAERKRLFAAVKGWDGYDAAKLSKGGRIYLRSEKSLKLTPEIMQRFDIERSEVTPAELIQAMLRGRTDLMWFGGIGTYVKAAAETHIDVGDKTNDALRIDAPEIRAKVIGEGANLAVTQRARIEYAQRGGRLNADFIDNSGGVDSSDHEVNIKILMTDVMASGGAAWTKAKRDKLLAEMTDDVGALVLRNNYQQSQGISLMEMQAPGQMAQHVAFMRDLEKRKLLSRKIEFLPDDDEIEERLAAGKGLTRPELGIVQAYSKIQFARDTLASTIPDEEEMWDYWLVDYFPPQLRAKYRDQILGHRLRREIVATTMANSLVNRMGPTFIKSQMERTGARSDQVTRAYVIVRDSFSLRPLWDRIESLDGKVPALVQLRAMRDIARVVDRETSWLLKRSGGALDISSDSNRFRTGIDALIRGIDSVLSAPLALTLKQHTRAGAADGLPEDLARHIALVPLLGTGCDITRISVDTKTDVLDAARIYFEVGELFHFDWLQKQAEHITPGDRWSAEARESLIEDLYACQEGIATHILRSAKSAKKDAVKNWLNTNANRTAVLESLFTEMRKLSGVDVPMLVIAVQKLRGLYGG